jgi:hypothetical protein
LINGDRYEALSYCWGDSTPSKFIKLQPYGETTLQDMPITENLNSALCALLRRAGGGNMMRLKLRIRLWVDAICINQGDAYERSQQVQMMRQIYSKAENVLAWVGPLQGRNLPSTIVEHLSKMQTMKSGRNQLLDETQLSSSNAKQRDIKSSKARQPVPYSPHYREEWSSLKVFFDEEYWRRVWIIQEITVASTVRVLYGDLEFSWEDVAAVLSTVVSSSVEQEHGMNSRGLAASHLLKFREHWIDGNKPIGLVQAMTWTRHTKATDPRDKIFALLGLCHDGFRLVQVPNYKQDLESIISEMTRLSFSLNRSLDLLCLKGYGTEATFGNGLPSWAPNWPNIWSGGTTLQEKSLLNSQTKFVFDPVLSNSTGTTIEVEGIFVQLVRGITTDPGDCTRHPPSQRQWTGPWLYSTHHLSKEVPGLNDAAGPQLSLRRKIWLTLTMNCLNVDIDLADADQCFTNLWTPHGRGSIYSTQLIDWIDRNAFFKIGRWTLREWSQLQGRPQTERETACEPGIDWPTVAVLLSKGKSRKQKEKLVPVPDDNQSVMKEYRRPWESFNTLLEQVIGGGMRLAALAKRSSLDHVKHGEAGVALVNPHAKVNDEIFILRGCSTPVTLRRENFGEAYTVVGPAWLLLEGPRLSSYQAWAQGKGDALEGAEIRVLSLI